MRRTEIARLAHEHAVMIALAKTTNLFVKATAVQRDDVQEVMSNDDKPLVQQRADVREIEAKESGLYGIFVGLFKEQHARPKAHTRAGG